MSKYKEVCRCKECGEIYDKGIPYICRKCGVRIGTSTPLVMQMLGHGEVTLTEKCEKVIAKRFFSDGKLEKKIIQKLRLQMNDNN